MRKLRARMTRSVPSMTSLVAATRSAGGPAAPPPPKRDLLDHPIRRQMVGLIHERPGLKISRVCEATGAGWGTIQHHLHLLKKAGLIVSRSIGRDCLLFSSDFPAAELPVAEALRRGRAERLATAIAQNPGASQKDLCARVQMTRKIIRRYVELLQAAGLVTERRDARFQRYYPDPRLSHHLSRLSSPVEPLAPAPFDAAPPEKDAP